MKIDLQRVFRLAILGLLFFLYLDSVAQRKISFTINGTIQNLTPGDFVYLETDTEPSYKRDSAKIGMDHSFSLASEVEEGGEILKLKFGDEQKVTLIIEGGESLKAIKDGGTINVTGSENMRYFNELKTLRTNLEYKVENWKKQLAEAKAKGGMNKVTQIEKEYQDAEQETINKVKSMLPAMGSSLVALYALNFINSDSDFATYEEVARRFSNPLSKNPHARLLVEEVERLKATALGKVAPEMILKDTTGTLVSLSSLRGQYVLIDFWASWCLPCRKENPELVKIYNKYHELGFAIYGVSLDQAKSSWTKAITKDKLTWTNVSDLKYWHSSVVKQYGLKAIPASILLDKNGKIIGRNLRGEALSEKLEKVLR